MPGIPNHIHNESEDHRLRSHTTRPDVRMLDAGYVVIALEEPVRVGCWIALENCAAVRTPTDLANASCSCSWAVLRPAETRSKQQGMNHIHVRSCRISQHCGAGVSCSFCSRGCAQNRIGWAARFVPSLNRLDHPRNAVKNGHWEGCAIAVAQ